MRWARGCSGDVMAQVFGFLMNGTSVVNQDNVLLLFWPIKLCVSWCSPQKQFQASIAVLTVQIVFSSKV
jgi:hypothetical protein